MQHPFRVLELEYSQLLSSMVVTRPKSVENAARSILANVPTHYAPVSAKTHVPAPMIGALNLRESDQNFHTGLGQGDPISRPSVHVPRGFGPWLTWEEAAEFYIHYDHLDDTTAPWTYAYACWKSEIWNGFGYRSHGVHSPYLWGGTNHQQPGKYVADGKWDSRAVDTQLGTIPVILKMIDLDPALAFGASILKIESPPIVPAPPPIGVNNTQLIQHLLNVHGQTPPLIEDGNYGRRTREAVRAFQTVHSLDPDGLAGPLTMRELEK